ncbi:MAG: hypothetical protein J0H67_04985 [Rhodospirillales bacterium]|nr:hypothetical protein [Rhodospirillales bacterium]
MTAFTFTPTDRAAISAQTTRRDMDFFVMTAGPDTQEGAIFATDEATEMVAVGHTALPLDFGAVAMIVPAEGAVVLQDYEGWERGRFGNVEEALEALRQAQLRYGEVAWDRLPG